MRILLILALVVTAAAAAAAPLHDPFIEAFLVGAYDRPDAAPSAVADDLFAPAVVDSLWLATAEAVVAEGVGAWHDLAAALPDNGRRAAFLARLDASLAALAARTAPDTTDAAAPFAAAVLTRAFFADLEADRRDAARAVAQRLASGEIPGLHEGARAAWSLRAAVLADQPDWPTLESLLETLGPWDTGNAWTLAVGMRRAAGMPVFGPDAGDDTALRVGGAARTWIEQDDLDAAPLGDDMRAALGAVVLPQAALADHFARWPDPPARSALQGWWLRGQRRLAGGDPERYEALASRTDLAPVWQMDLWRRASERRLLADQWTAGLEDLDRALVLAAQPAVAAGPSELVRDWTEQAWALARARGRTGDAARILALAQGQASVVKDERFRASVRLLEAWQSGTTPHPDSDDLVDIERLEVRDGLAGDVVPVLDRDRARLEAAATATPWETWRRWGLALSDTAAMDGLDSGRIAAAAAYRADLAAADGPQALAATAAARLAARPGVLERLAAWALDHEVQSRTGGATPPLPTPVPELAADLRGSQADLHALLGCALALGDMRGVLGTASVLPGTGLTRDEKRRFLYPLPAPGPILDALLAADDAPALLLAIARNESLFEPAVRSRAGALGWMQIMPFHYPERGARPGAEHWSNPRTAIARGAALVAENRRRYGGDPYRLLAAYNAGPEAVARWDRQLGPGADRRLFLAWIGYTETRDYVEKVLVDRAMYERILQEAAAGLRTTAEE
ncbi:MAG TPA: transglycosylase SLT domain-containing protein [Candidatus Krumholzibacteria bacterium]|nr:transglycosylase SLT domain-containing protein [Candidatus Krumholzibacteria bacterium]